MIGQPFRPPLLRKVERPEAPKDDDSDEPQTKKRRISDIHDQDEKQSRPQLVFKKPGISSLPPKPLLAIKNPAERPPAPKPSDGGVEGCYSVLWYGNFLLTEHL